MGEVVQRYTLADGRCLEQDAAFPPNVWWLVGVDGHNVGTVTHEYVTYYSTIERHLEVQRICQHTHE